MGTVLRSVSWVHFETGSMTARCVRCGGFHEFPTPLPVAAFPFFVRGFQECHRFCNPKEETQDARKN